MDDKLLDRVIHNHYMKNIAGNYAYQDLVVIKNFFNHLIEDGKVREFNLPKYKIGLMFVCINEQYWKFAKDVIEGARKYFMPDHNVEIMLWTDMPKEVDFGVTRFEAKSVGWPSPTLHRYDYFLSQEEYLKKFDYIYYLDIDMRFVNIVGDELLGDLVAAQHPMYALRQIFKAPFETRKESTAYVDAPQFYYAGAIQGGKTPVFIEAMKEMKKNIDIDVANKIIAIWNDESYWNEYLINTREPNVILSPAYVHPDSIIEEYYKKIWGCRYTPKIYTLTKDFSLTPESQEKLKRELETL